MEGKKETGGGFTIYEMQRHVQKRFDWIVL